MPALQAEPSFTLKASDPAAAESFRAYIDARRRQGALHLEMEKLSSHLLSFHTWVRQQLQTPPIQVAPLLVDKKPKPAAPKPKAKR